jgi:hypothetical protein
LGLRAIQFELGSDRLRSESIETLRNLGGLLNEELGDHDRLEAVGKGYSQPAVPKTRLPHRTGAWWRSILMGFTAAGVSKYLGGRRIPSSPADRRTESTRRSRLLGTS